MAVSLLHPSLLKLPLLELLLPWRTQVLLSLKSQWVSFWPVRRSPPPCFKRRPCFLRLWYQLARFCDSLETAQQQTLEVEWWWEC